MAVASLGMKINNENEGSRRTERRNIQAKAPEMETQDISCYKGTYEREAMPPKILNTMQM